MATIEGNCDDFTKDKLLKHVRDNFESFKEARPSLTKTAVNKMTKAELCELVLTAPQPAEVSPEIAEVIDEIAAVGLAEDALVAAREALHPVQRDCRKQLKKDILAFINNHIDDYPVLKTKSPSALAKMTISGLCDVVEIPGPRTPQIAPGPRTPQIAPGPRTPQIAPEADVPDCSKKLKTEIIAWIKQNLHRYPSLVGKSDSALNKMKKEELCAAVAVPSDVILPEPINSVVQEIMAEPDESAVSDPVETSCVKQVKNSIVAYIRRNIANFPELAGKSEAVISRMTKDTLCEEVKKVTEQKRKQVEARQALASGGRAVIQSIRQTEKEASKAAINEFKKYLPYLLADEKAQDEIAKQTVNEYLSPVWVESKLKEKKVSKSDAQRILTSAFKLILASAKEGKITLWLSNPQALAQNLKTVSRGIRDLRDAIDILFDRDSYMIQFVQWLQNAVFSAAKLIHDADARKKKREELLIKGDCFQKNKGTYVNLLLAHRELFPEVANLTASEINNLSLDDLCALVVKAKAAKTKIQVQQIYEEGLLDVAPRLKSELDSHLKLILATAARFLEYLLVPQYKGDDIGVKIVGARRTGIIDVLYEHTSKRFGTAGFTSHVDVEPHLEKIITTPFPTVQVRLMRYILTDLLPYADVLGLKVSPGFSSLAEFQNLPGMPYNDAILQRSFSSQLLPSVAAKLEKNNRGLFLTPESCNIIRTTLLKLAQIFATTDKWDALDLQPESIVGRSESLFSSQFLVPEDNHQDKMIADFVWITAGLCDWLDKKDIDNWDVYWAFSILSGGDKNSVDAVWDTAAFSEDMNSTASAIRRKLDSVDLLIQPAALQRLTSIVFKAAPTVASERLNMFAVPVY
jgi:hypothetical protein